MIAAFRVDELDVDAQAIPAALDASLQHITDVQLAADRRRIESLAFQREGGVARNDEGPGNTRQIGGEAFGEAVDQILLLQTAADIDEGQDKDRKVGPDGSLGRRRFRLSQRFDRVGALVSGDDRPDEAIAASGQSFDPALAAGLRAKHATQRRDLDGEVALLD